MADPAGTLSQELELLLAEEGLELAIVQNGRDALQSAVLEAPELIISDTDLPGMNGIDFCRAVRASEWLGRVPFVLIAGSVSREILAMATECGADLCLCKPVDPARLIELVRALLK